MWNKWLVYRYFLQCSCPKLQKESGVRLCGLFYFMSYVFYVCIHPSFKETWTTDKILWSSKYAWNMSKPSWSPYGSHLSALLKCPRARHPFTLPPPASGVLLCNWPPTSDLFIEEGGKKKKKVNFLTGINKVSHYYHQRFIIFHRLDVYFNFLMRGRYETWDDKRGEQCECKTPDRAVKGLDGFNRNRWVRL